MQNNAPFFLTLSRYRWGKLIDAEPSRFIEEIDPKYVHHIKPKEEYHYKPLVNTSIFGEPAKIERTPREKKKKQFLVPLPPN